MPTTTERIISADDHMDLNVLPVDLFTSRLPSKLRDRAPQVVDKGDGPVWEVEGTVLGPSGRKAQGLIRGHDHGFRPGVPEQRLEDMDRDGVYTHIIYGPPQGIPVPDVDLRVACLQAYNDWADEFNAVNRNRLMILAIIPGHTPEAATAELRRSAALGHKGVLLRHLEGDAPVFEEPWEPFWDAANEIGIPVNVHLGGGLHSLRARPNSWRHPAMVAVIPMQLDEVLVGMVFSGILERHPKVKIVLGESGLGWIPYVLARMDHEQHKYDALIHDVRLPMRPSEYFHRQIYVTYEEDNLGIEMLDRIGSGNVMWASDYPHGDSTWPDSLQAIEESGLGKLDGDSRRRILWDNAAELYNIV